MSAEKTLEILEQFDFENRAFTVPELAERLKQPQSSVYRHMRLLKEKGYIVEYSPGVYCLGYIFLKLAKIIKMDIDLPVISQEAMRELTKVTGETSILLVPSNMQAVCLSSVPSGHPVKVSSEQGNIVPLYGGASSKALLAFMGDSTVDELYERVPIQAHTDNTIIQAKKMKEHLEAIRQVGFAYSDSEIDEGVVSIGLPIFDSDDKLLGSLSVAGPRDRMSKKPAEEFVAEIRKAVTKIEVQL
ncbi:IclR family transcriptional regulator [Sporosarcina aquimarina]|uniref:IclR family transcriptional regulator n=1 Tax=Sporosarcina aquimarina TaxID=114975 RepID=UPI002040627B|nr:IclR family transcriptional regulator [Sporosarcina aquimarina]MCM3756336.1 IclR family transcriptional regulator [Sporosarcina aquimarina]